MIIVYTGDGKGKTSACLGQVVRALGHGMSVAFAQFMKRDGEAGEQVFLRQVLHENFFAGGAGFFRNELDRPLHRHAAEQTLAWARQHIGLTDVLVLDECLYALRNALLTMEELQALLEESKLSKTHLILSGRGFPTELLYLVDTVTEMGEIKHPWQAGQSAMLGLDF